MQMGADDAVNRASAHQLRKMFFPDRFALSVANPRINDDPAITIN
jgi:hypothetical protein